MRSKYFYLYHRTKGYFSSLCLSFCPAFFAVLLVSFLSLTLAPLSLPSSSLIDPRLNNPSVRLLSASTLLDSPSDHGGQTPNQSDCGTWVRNINGGVFTSPNYPNTYPPNKECVYILEGTGKPNPFPCEGVIFCLVAVVTRTADTVSRLSAYCLFSH